jgi:hypothetical protein
MRPPGVVVLLAVRTLKTSGVGGEIARRDFSLHPRRLGFQVLGFRQRRAALSGWYAGNHQLSWFDTRLIKAGGTKYTFGTSPTAVISGRARTLFRTLFRAAAACNRTAAATAANSSCLTLDGTLMSVSVNPGPVPDAVHNLDESVCRITRRTAISSEPLPSAGRTRSDHGRNSLVDRALASP